MLYGGAVPAGEVEDMEAPRRPVCDSAIEAVDDELATVCLQVRVSYTHVHVQKLPSVVCPTRRLTTSVLGPICSQYLSGKELGRLSCCSKRWLRLTGTVELWRNALIREFGGASLHCTLPRPQPLSPAAI